jgi:hypothetical protein
LSARLHCCSAVVPSQPGRPKPTANHVAQAEADVAEEHRLADEARARNKARGRVFRPEDWGPDL